MKRSDYIILFVDDDLDYARLCARAAAAGGYTVSAVQSADEAIKTVESDQPPHLVITDLQMPVIDGLELLHEIKLRNETIEVVIMTGYGTIETAVRAIKGDATDYITKPFNRDELLQAIKKIYHVWKRRREIEQLKRAVSHELRLSGFVFKSTLMSRVYGRISSAAGSDCSVLITGESGTGKELIAHAIHSNSSRSDGPFVPINCSAISGQLIESELFGFRKGAFTGAERNYDGLFVAADGGTLFLDEISEMPVTTQAKLLRAVQEKSVRPVGSLDERAVNVRFVAATNMNIKDALSKHLLREDLYHRLNVIQIDIPPLRKMPDEISDLLDYFISHKSSDHKGSPLTFDESSTKILNTYSWPGNIREAENLVDQLLAQGVSELVRVKDLPDSLTNSTRQRSETGDLVPSFTEAERELIIRALKESRGNKSKAAEILGISRPRLYKKIDQYKINEV